VGFVGILPSFGEFYNPERHLICVWRVELVGFVTKFDDFPPDFYGMKRARVGAFTDFGTF